MRSLTVVLLLICLACCLKAPVEARLPIPYPTEPPPEIAAKIAEAQTTAELKHYLESSQESVRVAAVRRIAEIADKGAVETIKNAFSKEPGGIGMMPQVVKEEMLHALGQIGGDGAKLIVVNILNRYVEKGPQTERYIWHNGDYTSVVTAAIQVLAQHWHRDPKVHRQLRDIAFKGTEDRFDSWMRQEAYQGLLLEDMRRRGVAGLEACAEYLLTRLTRKVGASDDWVKGEEGVMTLEAIRNLAITNLLVRYREAVVPYVQRELETLPAEAEQRREALRNALYLIGPEKYSPLLRKPE